METVGDPGAKTAARDARKLSRQRPLNLRTVGASGAGMPASAAIRPYLGRPPGVGSGQAP